MNPFYQQLRKDCEEISLQAITLLSSYQGKFQITVQKDIGDFATTADEASEVLIKQFISEKYPKHCLYAEESGLSGSQSEYRWIVDPLDGTKEYARGSEEYNCLIAVEHNTKIVAAVIRRHGTNNLYSMAFGNGSLHNGNPIHVSSQTDLEKSFIGFHLPPNSKSFEKIEIDKSFDLLKDLTYASYRVRCGWDDAKLLGWVARGVIDAHIVPAEVKNGWWDLAPGIAIVLEAGGMITTMKGNPVTEQNCKIEGIVASNGKLHKELLQLINKEFYE